MKDYISQISKNLSSDNPEIEARIKHGTELYRKSTAEITLVDNDGQTVQNAQLRYKQFEHEYDFGANIFMLNQFDSKDKNQAYESTFAELFNLAVIPFYWSDLEPEEGNPRFASNSLNIYRRPAPDLCLDFCDKYNIRPKGHPLLWFFMLPDWLERKGSKIAIEKHVRGICERYGNRIRNWDVINEIMDRNVPEERLPDDAIDFAFDLARKYLPESTVLNYNDFLWMEYEGNRTGLYLMLKDLIAKGKKLDALGLQFHLMGDDPEKMLKEWPKTKLNAQLQYNCLDQYAKLGIPCNMSEITVNSPLSLGNIREEYQAQIAERLYRIWFSHPNTNGIIYWNLVDNTAHVDQKIPHWNENRFMGGIVNNDDKLSRKEIFKTLKRLIKEEWNSSGELDYNAEKANFIRGFHGDYKLNIKTNSGSFNKEISIMQGKVNKITIKLE